MPERVTETTEHRLNEDVRYVTYVLAIFMVGAGIFFVVLWLSDDQGRMGGWEPLVVVETIAFGGAGVVLGTLRRATASGVVVDGAGIRSLDRARPYVFVSWASIERVHINRPRQRIEVLARSSTSTEPAVLWLAFVLEDFDGLVATMLRELPQVGRSRPLPAVFHAARGTIELDERELRIRRLPGRRIRLREIERVTLHGHHLTDQIYDLRVQLELRSRETVVLPRLRGDEVFDLYRTLAWAAGNGG